jgi:cell division protein FtsW
VKNGPDWWLLVTTVLLLFLGVFIVFDASYARAAQSSITGQDTFFYLKRQGQWAALSLLAFAMAMRTPYWRLRRWWAVILGFAVLTLILVAIPGIGKEVNGSRRWIGLGPMNFQPSEFAKLALVICIASYAALRKADIKDPLYGLAPILAVTSVLGALVAHEDLGTAVSLVMTGLIMAFVAGAQKRHLAIFCLVGAIGFGLFVSQKKYRMERVQAFMDPWKHYHGPGYQPAHALIALGSGGLTGKGIARGSQKFLYLPAEHTDYIFATVGEETGLAGSLGLLGLFAFFIVRGLTIAHRTRDRFGSLLASGLTSMLAVQALLNVAVVTSSVPATGVPLPFVSYGGSSLVFTLLSVGLIQSVAQYPYGSSTANRIRESDSDRRWHRRASVSGY